MRITIIDRGSKLEKLERESTLVKWFMDENRNEGGSERDGDTTIWELDLIPTAALEEVLKEMEAKGIEVRTDN